MSYRTAFYFMMLDQIWSNSVISITHWSVWKGSSINIFSFHKVLGPIKRVFFLYRNKHSFVDTLVVVVLSTSMHVLTLKKSQTCFFQSRSFAVGCVGWGVRQIEQYSQHTIMDISLKTDRVIETLSTCRVLRIVWMMSMLSHLGSLSIRKRRTEKFFS